MASLMSDHALGQAEADDTVETDTVLDLSPFTSTRAAGMGGALSTIADDMDALYYNPAGIGGLGFDSKSEKRPFFKGLYFPYVGGSLNENARKVHKEFTATGAQSDAGAGAAILDANAGKRQYARASFIPIGMIFGRVAAVPIVDHQIASVPTGTEGLIKMRYRTFSGVMVGSSIADNGNRFSLGVSQMIGSIDETLGTFDYVEMVDVDQRKVILKDNRKTYSAGGQNVGLTIRIPKSVTPTFSVVARNMGNTKNAASKPEDDPLIYEEDLTAGFSISPDIGRIGRFHLLIEGGNLTQKHTAARKKLRGGAELLLGGETSKSLLGIRAGGNDAGASYGVHLNLGLIGVEVESHAVDIGINNDRVIERRSSAVVYIDVGGF